MAALSVRPNGAEDVGYNAPDYPVRTRDGDLIRFVGYAAACHWHENFELLLPVQGGLNYFVNGARVYVPEGCAYSSIPGGCTTAMPMRSRTAATGCCCSIRPGWVGSRPWPRRWIICRRTAAPMICC